MCREKNRAFQSDEWGKSADKDAIVRQIFIRILKTLHCAKIGGLRVTGITEVEQDSEMDSLDSKTIKELISFYGLVFTKTLFASHLPICKFSDVIGIWIKRTFYRNIRCVEVVYVNA